MFAQKKYRDKRLHAAELVSFTACSDYVYTDPRMSESIVQFQVALDRLGRETPEDCLDRIQYFMSEYRLDMEGKSPPRSVI
jgi:hypothetical protein